MSMRILPTLNTLQHLSIRKTKRPVNRTSLPYINKILLQLKLTDIRKIRRYQRSTHRRITNANKTKHLHNIPLTPSHFQTQLRRSSILTVKRIDVSHPLSILQTTMILLDPTYRSHSHLSLRVNRTQYNNTVTLRKRLLSTIVINRHRLSLLNHRSALTSLRRRLISRRIIQYRLAKSRTLTRPPHKISNRH